MTHWGVDHLTAIAVMVAGAAGLVLIAQKPQPGDQRVRRVAAVLLLVNESAAWGFAFLTGHPRVPLQLCDLALLLTVVALWRPGPKVSQLAYYWVMAGSIQAILTPDLRRGFPDYWWIKFFITHIGSVWGVVYLVAAGHVRLSRASLWQAWLATNVYAVFAGLINWRWGTNYGYLAHKPSQPSLLDFFGPWPWYIMVLEVLALGSFTLYYGLARTITRRGGV